jgi:hypothetical protein
MPGTMNLHARRLALSVALLLAMLFGAGPLPSAGTAGAATPHRAAVIVDTGTAVHQVVITFTEDSITGIEALVRAKADPVVYSFNGQGGAVCRVFGTGRDAGPDCLGGQDGDARYWAYFRAPAGTDKFTYSSVGAGTAKVHDGDVEGWKFGTGAAPEFVSLDSLAPPAQGPGATTPPTQPPAGANPSAGNSVPAPPGAGPTRTPDAGAAATSGSTLPVAGATGATAQITAPPSGATGSSREPTARERDEATQRKQEKTDEAALASSSTDGGGSGGSLIWFGVLLAVIVVAIVIARRVRRRAQTPLSP